MAGPPPILRDNRLDLATLSAMAREFDQISRGEHWPATDFVRWLESEWRASREQAPRLSDVEAA
jgi:hypothetical protein